MFKLEYLTINQSIIQKVLPKVLQKVQKVFHNCPTACQSICRVQLPLNFQQYIQYKLPIVANYHCKLLLIERNFYQLPVLE